MDQRSTDWFSALLGNDFNESHQTEGNGMEVDDENDDFYGESEGQAGVPNHAEHVGASQLPVQTSSLPQQNTSIKSESQLRAEFLRAKLLATRKTAVRQQSNSRSNTPVKKDVQRATSLQTPAQETPPPNHIPNTPQNIYNHTNMNDDAAEQPAGGMLNLDALLDEGKALADAKSAAMTAASPTSTTKTVSLTNGHANTKNSKKNQNQHHSNNNNNNKKEMVTNMNKNKNKNKTVPTAQEQAQPTPTKVLPAEPSHTATNLSDAYYADLSAWLEMTGFHDIDFRNSKLSAYKERKSLEEEAARIAERLEKLRQLEQENVQSLRFGTPKSAAAMAPPPLPTTMSVERSSAQVDGTKRARSPEPFPVSKRREENGFHIRRANDSPVITRPSPAGNRRQSPSPSDINRRISYPDPRRRDEDDIRSRDPSLERRQNFYRRDSDEYDRRAPQAEYPGREYDSYHPRDGTRLGFSTTNMAPPSRPTPSTTPASIYRGSVGLDLKRGGQFISRD